MDALWTPQYYQKVLALDPIAYWMLDEKSGTVAYDLVSGRVAGAQNGAHTGVTLGQPGIGDGRTSPLYDGANDYTDIYSAALNTAFDGDEGTLLIRTRVSGAGVWTDGTARFCIQLFVDADNFVRIARSAANNSLNLIYRAGGTTKQRGAGGQSQLGFMLLGITWSISTGGTGEARAYIDGVQSGATMVALGAWAGNLDNARCLIGANTKGPTNPWDGYQAHGVALDRPLSPTEIAELWAVE